MPYLETLIRWVEENPGPAVGVSSVCVTIALFTANWVSRKRERREDREREQAREGKKADAEQQTARAARIQLVVDEYVRNVRSLLDSHITGLIRGGIAELETEEEVREAIRMIDEKETGHPIPRNLKHSLMASSTDVLCVFRKWKAVGYGHANPPVQFEQVIHACQRTQEEGEPTPS